MSKALQTTYTTSLETVDKPEIIEVLNRKLAMTTPQGLVDYIGFGLDNLNDREERIKVMIDEAKLALAQVRAQKEYIKQEVAEFFVANGVSKIEGDRVSSITIFNPKPSDELNVLDENALIDFGYAKVTLDKTAVKNAVKAGLISEDLAYLTQSFKPTTIKINKKRGA